MAHRTVNFMNDSRSVVTRRHFVIYTGALASARFLPALAAEPGNIAPQPYFANVRRAVAKMAELGAPLASVDAKEIAALAKEKTAAAVTKAEKILDRYTLARVTLGTDGIGRATPGGAKRTLVEQGWRMFLVRVENSQGKQDTFDVSSGYQTPGHMGDPSGAQRPALMDTLNKAPLVEKMWLMSEMADTLPLSGFTVEYRVIQLFSRDHGKHSNDFAFAAGGQKYGTATYSNAIMAFYSGPQKRLNLDFDALPSRDVLLGVLDTDGRSCMASFVIKDEGGRIYPAQAMRLAPDMAFEPQIYRANGETVRLPDGEYTVESWRGPEYLHGTQIVQVGNGHDRIAVKLERWIDPAKWGWYSGDTHIHAAGCAHYENPTEGVTSATMIRHVRGEALAIGDVLSWGPGWYYQKTFFTGHVESPAATLEHPELQVANNVTWTPRPTAEDSEGLLRYDIEVSGFPSSLCGHLVLLRLKEQDYPGTKLIEDWPSWTLPILKWAREQGAVGGFPHCAAGGGLAVDSKELPNYLIPSFDSIGMNEVFIDVTHGYADFISGCQVSPVSELNGWYHMLNCGFRIVFNGETDWPCFSGERPGLGRTYVRCDRHPKDDAGFDAWVRGLQKGKLYCGDGRSHFLAFGINGHASGEDDVTLDSPGTIDVRATIAARLEPEVTPEIKTMLAQETPCWHIERARIGKTREVSVELVVNGIAIDKTSFLADGTPQEVSFKANIAHSSWVALRILPSSHTYPVFVMVGGKPIRASKKSAQWCLACVDKLWEVKSPFMRDSERPEAAKAWDHARKTYDTVIAECESV